MRAGWNRRMEMSGICFSLSHASNSFLFLFSFFLFLFLSFFFLFSHAFGAWLSGLKTQDRIIGPAFLILQLPDDELWDWLTLRLQSGSIINVLIITLLLCPFILSFTVSYCLEFLEGWNSIPWLVDSFQPTGNRSYWVNALAPVFFSVHPEGHSSWVLQGSVGTELNPDVLSSSQSLCLGLLPSSVSLP